MLLTGVVLLLRFWAVGDLDVAHGVLTFFISVNLVASFWEICLLLRIDTIEERKQHWNTFRLATGKVPALEFLTKSVSFRRIFSPRVWSDLWGVYSLYDSSYTDRKTFGFIVDIGNGAVTPFLSLLLLGTVTIPFLPAQIAGILGVLLFWQWIYVTSLYMVSFYIMGRHRLIDRRERLIYIWVPNLFWILLPIFGFYISVRLILEGSYIALGLN